MIELGGRIWPIVELLHDGGPAVVGFTNPGSSCPAADKTVREYVRADMDGEDKTTTHPVLFTEPTVDRHFNLPDAHDDDKEVD
ncbi:heat shock mitochondrial precursor [Fusarium albosuccineum]|uniref:Heat shock mitochondrial n=1 Tax=Fusarium albosuccineum TaxID=1237068 RepID=A0A8H4LH76_9HYPO|nr:heat shock mitochondrial precursor [Fusarium albosuccineum]